MGRGGGIDNLLLLVIFLAIFAYIFYEGVVTNQAILILLGAIGVIVFFFRGRGR